MIKILPAPSNKGVLRLRKTLPLRPTPPVGWENLSDAYLLRIFAYIPQADLRPVALVCRNWSTAQKRALSETQELAIFTGAEAKGLLLGKEVFPSQNLAALKQKIAHSRITLPNLKPATLSRLLQAFPNVKDLCLSASKIKAKYVSQLGALLQGLSSSLIKLHLVATFKGSYDVSQSAAGLELLRAVNALPNLKNLTVDFKGCLIVEDVHGNAISNVKHLSFPVLSRLVEFNFKTQNDAKFLVETFRSFATGNASLQTIRLASCTFDASSWEPYLNLNARLLATFKYLHVYFEAHNHETLVFSRLFPRLTSLTDLEFTIEGDAEDETPYSEAIGHLATLSSLKVLKLSIETYLAPGQPAVPIGFPQLATVRKLTLELFSDSHTETLLDSCYIDWVFPRLEEVAIHFTIRGCSECYHFHEEFTLKEAKRCARKLYGGQVGTLKKLAFVKKKVVTFSWERHFPDERRSTTELGFTV